MLSILENHRSLEQFTLYCEQKFCDENIKFWLTVQHYKSLTSEKERILHVHDITKDYIQYGAPMQVNIDGFVVSNILKNKETSPLPSDLFTEAEQNIILLLEMDILPGFIKSQNSTTTRSKSPNRRKFELSPVFGRKRIQNQQKHETKSNGNFGSTLELPKKQRRRSFDLIVSFTEIAQCIKSPRSPREAKTRSKKAKFCACGIDEVPEDGGKLVEFTEGNIALFMFNHKVLAIQDKCIRKHCSLSNGKFELIRKQPYVRCLKHQYLFNLITGECFQLVRVLPTFPVQIVGEKVFLDLPS